MIEFKTDPVQDFYEVHDEIGRLVQVICIQNKFDLLSCVGSNESTMIHIMYGLAIYEDQS